MPEQGQIATNQVKGIRGFTQLKYRWESQNRWKLSVKFSKALLEQKQVLQFSHLHAFMPQYEAATLARPTGGAQDKEVAMSGITGGKKTSLLSPQSRQICKKCP